MKEFLTEEEYNDLRLRHKREKDGRTKDRIKVVLLSHLGWTFKKISEALFLDEETVSKHLYEYLDMQKLSIKTGGSVGKLNEVQKEELFLHLEVHTYTKASDICVYVSDKYNVTYTHRSMANWLRNNGFSYKKPKLNPKKIDVEAQKKFVEEYEKLVEETPKEEPILFMDAVHPTMATKTSYGWIKTGTEKLISSGASRTRMNIIGAINLQNMDVETEDYQTVNSDTIIEFFDKLKEKYPGKIHIILDQAGYHKSEQTREAAKERNIILHFLPTYSPNLNPIERLWKVMNEYVRNNVVFSCIKEFKKSILNFFLNTWTNIKEQTRSIVNSNFQLLQQSNFSQ